MGAHANMKVILDSNILFSALISPHGVANSIYQAWRKNLFDLITCQKQIDEIRRASRYAKFKSVLQPTRVGVMINYLYQAIVIEILNAERFADCVNDPNDAFLLAMAHESQADYLVTGDHRAGILKLKNIDRTRIANPNDFYRLLELHH